MSYSHISLNVPKNEKISKMTFQAATVLFSKDARHSGVLKIRQVAVCEVCNDQLFHLTLLFFFPIQPKTADVLFKPAFAEEDEEEIAETAPLGTRWHTLPYSAPGKTVEAA